MLDICGNLAINNKFCTKFLQGKCLTSNQKPPSFLYSILDLIWARLIAAILYPIHMLANKLVYSKIRSTIGISKVLYYVLCFIIKYFIVLLIYSISSTKCHILTNRLFGSQKVLWNFFQFMNMLKLNWLNIIKTWIMSYLFFIDLISLLNGSLFLNP